MKIVLKSTKEYGARLPFAAWVRDRPRQGRPCGLSLTTTALIALLFLVSFLGVLIIVWLQGFLLHFDAWVLGLLPSIRAPGLTTFFRTVTALADTQTAALLMGVIIALLWHKHQR